jgi:hypothetical protein
MVRLFQFREGVLLNLPTRSYSKQQHTHWPSQLAGPACPACRACLVAQPGLRRRQLDKNTCARRCRGQAGRRPYILTASHGVDFDSDYVAGRRARVHAARSGPTAARRRWPGFRRERWGPGGLRSKEGRHGTKSWGHLNTFVILASRN